MLATYSNIIVIEQQSKTKHGEYLYHLSNVSTHNIWYVFHQQWSKEAINHYLHAEVQSKILCFYGVWSKISKEEWGQKKRKKDNDN